MKDNKKSRIQSINKCFKVLETIAYSPRGELAISELTELLGWNRTTVYRFIQTLVDEGYIRMVPLSERYRLTFKLVDIANQVVNCLDIRQISRPYMISLMKKWQTNVHLAFFDDGEVFFIDRIECENTLNSNFQIGKRAPVHATAVGKVLLAHMEKDMLKYFLDKYNLYKYTNTTISDKKEFEKELNKIKETGYSVDNGEYNPETHCVAAAIHDADGNVLAGISLSKTQKQFMIDNLSVLGTSVRETAEQISIDLGWIPSRF